jgi:hypothetical protein
MKTAVLSRGKGPKRAKPRKAEAARATGRGAVALAVRKALLRKPKINSALVKLFQANRDTL